MANKITLKDKVEFLLKNEGIVGLIRKTVFYIPKKYQKKKENQIRSSVFKDVLFINGCDYNLLPHPPRYRIKHQIEQLEANNISCDEIFYLNLNKDLVKNYRCFIIFRAPINEQLVEFIRTAKEFNKKVIFDIDDLVIDTKYTDSIKYLDSMSQKERLGYNQGVFDMQKTLMLCDAAITTTERLATELKNYVNEVYINRNVASEEMVALSEDAYRITLKTHKKIKLGYFSGSITHNDDFVLIKNVIKKVMNEFGNVELHICGLLDIPDDFNFFKERIVAHPFMDWKKLPKLIAEMDINLAPIEENIFNEAKSENKWIEASLVRVPTVASNVGAFKHMIKNGETGLLCNSEDEWYLTLVDLIRSKEYREKIGLQAYKYCSKKCVSIYTGFYLASFLRKIMNQNVFFIVPALKISGGVMVSLEHCCILREAGYDVTIINDDFDKSTHVTFNNIVFPVLPSRYSKFYGHMDRVVSTMWSTVSFLENYPNIEKRFYLVQGFETDFYESGNPHRIEANKTYSPKINVNFLTVSKWCQSWLVNEFQKNTNYVPNGIHYSNYEFKKRDFNNKKIRILIEGDCGVHYKNVDDSFKITNQLNKNKFEVWYLSYNEKPKEWYEFDKCFNKIPFEEVSNIYKNCDILLKTSFLESFSYPPLEMMASGGMVIAVENDGNKEYLVHEKNCLLIPLGDIEAGLNAINRVCTDEKLRDVLYRNGIDTAKSRDWYYLKDKIIKVYE